MYPTFAVVLAMIKVAENRTSDDKIERKKAIMLAILLPLAFNYVTLSLLASVLVSSFPLFISVPRLPNSLIHSQ